MGNTVYEQWRSGSKARLKVADMANYLYLLTKRQTIWALSQSSQLLVMQHQQTSHKRQLMTIQVNRVVLVLDRVRQRRVLAGYKGIERLAEERQEAKRRERQLTNKANRTLQHIMRQYDSESKKTVVRQLRRAAGQHTTA